ncbi:hypothetical protein bcgnr5378_04990 [Bacillus cereus]|uniref:Uncharacterized protein n=1 Tax=Bacillus cereus TaxID=1396 RepID=A0A164LE58_BACCE|nr:hypothetical protein [Bacillus cereus]KZD55719.1 hypothetical protein B4088_5464 [Bacillus cereus]
MDLTNNDWYQAGYKEGYKEGVAIGIAIAEKQVIIRLIEGNEFDDEKIAQFIGTDVGYVQKLRRQLNQQMKETVLDKRIIIRLIKELNLNDEKIAQFSGIDIEYIQQVRGELDQGKCEW